MVEAGRTIRGDTVDIDSHIMCGGGVTPETTIPVAVFGIPVESLKKEVVLMAKILMPDGKKVERKVQNYGGGIRAVTYKGKTYKVVDGKAVSVLSDKVRKIYPYLKR